MAQRQDSEDGLELTEKLVLTRTRAPDLESVRKLNCWASNISDVSVVRKLPNLEVCSLSINRITSLRDFAHCYKLKELYVRTNRISCLGDIHYLKSLSRLRYLWLSENPCADAHNYRLTVLRTLPRLQKLDNAAVSPEEVHEALSSVDEIPMPDDFSASSVFNRPLNISSVSSVSSVSLDGVLSPRSSNADPDVVSPRESLPAARRKREQRRQKKAEEDSARRSAEEEFVRTSLERKKIEDGSEDGRKERKNSDESGDDNDEMGDSNGSVSDDLKVSTDSESSGSVLGNSGSPVSDENDIDNMQGSGGDFGRGDKKGEDSSSEKCVGVGVVSKQSIDSQNYSNGDNNNGSNSDKFDQKEIIKIDKDRNNRNSNNNKNDDNRECENDFNKDGKLAGDFTNRDGGLSKYEDNEKVCLTGDSLLDKIRLDDSLAIDDDEADHQNLPHDSIELDDVVVEVREENQTLTNEVRLDDNSKKSENEIVDSMKNDNDDKAEDGDKEKSTDTSAQDVDGCMKDGGNGRDANIAAVVSSTSSPRSRPVDNKIVSTQKESVDWDQYNRMRQDIGMRPIEKGSSVTARPVSANVARARNGNILQAVLSLMKELDKDSLEIVSSAAQTRIDSL